MRAFDQAWSLLKEMPTGDELLGQGAFRRTYSKRGEPQTAIKFGGNYADEVATANALSQMGFPVLPEKPVVGYDRSISQYGLATEQPRIDATGDGMSPTVDFDENDNDAIMAYNFALADAYQQGTKIPREQMMELYSLERLNPLFRAMNINDIRRANVGVKFPEGFTRPEDFEGTFSDEELDALHQNWKVLDFQTIPPRIYRQDEPLRDLGEMMTAFDTENRPTTLFNLKEWLKVPKEQRVAFANLFSDRSQFDDWRNNLGALDDVSNEQRADSSYGKYLQNANSLKLMNSLIDDPQQTRLFEFDDETPYGKNWRGLGDEDVDRLRFRTFMNDMPHHKGYANAEFNYEHAQRMLREIENRDERRAASIQHDRDMEKRLLELFNRNLAGELSQEEQGEMTYLRQKLQSDIREQGAFIGPQRKEVAVATPLRDDDDDWQKRRELRNLPTRKLLVRRKQS